MIPHKFQSPTNESENPAVAYIESNTKGRDFILGDLHGSLSSLEELMGKVRFDTTQDRILCVGDLTDRGPDSIGCIKLLQEPWFHCTLGNHDENTIQVLNTHLETPKANLLDKEPWVFLAINGGQWLCEESANSKNRKTLLESLPLLKTLPRILIVGKEEQRFHIVHAAAIKNAEKMLLLTNTQIDLALTGEKPIKNVEDLNNFRDLAKLGEDNQKEAPELNLRFATHSGLSKTFCGHTPLPQPVKILSHLHIDTGAGKPDLPTKIRFLTAIEAYDPKETPIQVRAGFPRLKLKTKDIVENALKSAQNLEFSLT